MESIAKIVNELRATNSSKEKLIILEKYKDNKYLEKILEYTYNPFKKYGITDKVFNNYPGTKIDNLSLFKLLDELSEGNINDELRNKTVSFVKSENKEIEDVLKCIFCKDLKIGMSSKSINKVFKNLIPEFDVQLAITLDKAKFENEKFWVTEKFDGIRCVCIIMDELDIKFFSRNGKEITGLNELTEEVKMYKINNGLFNKVVLDGELLKVNSDNMNSGDLYRETVSVVNSKLENKLDIEFNVFDIISYEEFSKGKSNIKYSDRRSQLDSLENTKLVKRAEVLYNGSDKNIIYDLLKEVEEKGKEGLMVNLDDYYVTKRSKSLIKCKTMLTADLEIVDYKEGTGRNKGRLGSFVVRYKNGNLVDVGSGYSDLQREEFWKNKDMFIGQVIEVQYFEESINKNGEISLRFPVFRAIRLDKDKADF